MFLRYLHLPHFRFFCFALALLLLQVCLPGAPGEPFPTMTVKFHEKPIYEVIADEQAAKKKRRF